MEWMSQQVNVLLNVSKSLVPVEQLITGAAYLMGLLFAFKAIYSLKIYGEARTMMSSSASLKEPMTYFLVAGMLIYFPTAFEIFMNTMFGYSNILAYAPVQSGSPLINAMFGSESQVGGPFALVIQVVGLAAFVRGWVLIARAASHGQSPGGTGKGLMHVFGGVLAINIVGTLEVINNTLFGT